jgi:multidrug efflux pump subunit AcrA (membrane-fusion protein)
VSAELELIDSRDEYEALKAKVQVGFDAMLEGISAAKKIRDRRLWRFEYDSWDDFCRAELEQSGRRMYQQMQAAEVHALLPAEVAAELNEAQLRALKPAADVSPERAVEVLETVAESGPVTAKRIQAEIKPPETVSWKGLKAAVGALEQVVAEARAMPDGTWIPIDRIRVHLANVTKAIDAAKPAKTCPYCGGKPGGCETCDGLGKVTNAVFKMRRQELE